MMNGLSFDVGNGAGDCGAFAGNAQTANAMEAGVESLLQLLSDTHCKATFFVLGAFARCFPRLVRRLAGEGHEIASQGYGMEPVEAQTQYAFRRNIANANEVIESITGQKVVGYRAPGFSLSRECMWVIDILGEMGFSYDSSITAAMAPRRAGLRDAGRGIYRFENGVMEFPLSACRFLRVNFMLSGAPYFRQAPYLLNRFLAGVVRRRGNALIYGCHSPKLWQGRREAGMAPHGSPGGRFEMQLRHFLRNFKFQPLKEFLFDTVHDPYAGVPARAFRSGGVT